MKPNTTSRNSSIELLRIIAIVGVVILHYNNASLGAAFTYVEDGSINQKCLFFFESLFICAVNLFIMISAFYLSNTNKRRMIKVAELIMQVILFRMAYYIAGTIISGGVFSVKSLAGTLLPSNYFVILYSVLYIISPYFNVIIERISEKNLLRLIIILFGIFSVWSYGVDVLESISSKEFMGLSSVGMYGSQAGYSIVNFTLVYFIGAFINKRKIKVRAMTAGIATFVLVMCIWLWALTEQRFGWERTAWNYNNPLVILTAVAVLLLFLNFNYRNRVINELAKGAFTCFLFHRYFLPKVRIEEFVNKNMLIMVAHLIGVAIALYILSYIVYKIYSLCTGWFVRLITPLFDKINISLD